MYAIIDVGSFQFKVSEGDLIDTPRLDSDVGQNFDINEVLVVANGEDVRVGDPYVKGARVTAEIVRHFLDEKDINFIYRKRKDTRKKKGHRQPLTAIKITKISV